MVVKLSFYLGHVLLRCVTVGFVRVAVHRHNTCVTSRDSPTVAGKPAAEAIHTGVPRRGTAPTT